MSYLDLLSTLGLDPLSARTPPFLPQRMPRYMPLPMDEPPVPPQAAPMPRGLRAGLGASLGGMLRGAAVGMAMPSTGSGAMDAARAFVASDDDRTNRELQAMQLQRQRQQDERQAIMDDLMRRQREADLAMQPMRQRLMESQVSENEAQAARNQAMHDRSMRTPAMELREKVEAIRQLYPEITQRELGTALGLWGPQYDPRRSYSITGAESANAALAMDAEDAATREEFLRNAERARSLGKAPRPMAPRIDTRTGQSVQQNEQGEVVATPIKGWSAPPQAGPRGSRTSATRQMTPGQQRTADIEAAASQALSEAESWIAANKRTDLDPVDLAIRNARTQYRNDPRFTQNYAAIVSKLQKLKIETNRMTKSGDDEEEDLSKRYAEEQKRKAGGGSAPTSRNPFR